jgi:hypothetical protein
MTNAQLYLAIGIPMLFNAVHRQFDDLLGRRAEVGAPRKL